MRNDLRPSSARARALLIALALLAGCATQPQFGMEAPGRPAVTWQHEKGEAAETPDERATETEHALVAKVREAERQGNDQPALADALYRLAILRRGEGDFSEAERLYRRALEIRTRAQGANHPDVAAVLNNLAGVEVARGHYDDALPLLERALAIRQSALGDEHLLTAESLNNLALLHAAQGNAAAAEPLYRQAITIFEKTGASHSNGLDRVLDNYAALLHDTQRDREADELEARAHALRAAEHGANAAP